MIYTTYKKIDIFTTVDDGRVSGFCINGLAKSFESPAEAMRYIDGLEAFSALNGAIISFKE